MSCKSEFSPETASSLSPLLAEDAFFRLDESDDREFYAKDRLVEHLDARALSTVERIIGRLVLEEAPVILDLMAGWDSHLPPELNPAEVVGLGLNPNELSENPVLTRTVIHDLNRDQNLPFPDETFDVVINTVSVDYLTRPVEVFREVGRVLKPGGLFLVIFSNRMFPQKAVKVWREAGEEERVLLVEDFFRDSGIFEKPKVFVSKGQPRPQDDKYAGLGLPSDPVYAVYADKPGGAGRRKPRPELFQDYGRPLTPEELAKRKKAIKQTLACPYCGEKMRKWAVPDNPFVQTWDNEYMYICFNDACYYYGRGWEVMHKQGNSGRSYRLMYDPVKDCCLPVPVPTPHALKEGICD